MNALANERPVLAARPSAQGEVPGNEAARLRLASAPNTDPQTLLDLAHDQSVLVRAAVAANPRSYQETHEVLAADADERVRGLLGVKLAKLIPDLARPAHLALRDRIAQTLTSLARDECVRVRQALADIVKDMDGVPRGLVLQLARDTDMAVADPVIRLSPLLGPDDLLALLAESAAPLAVRAVARRTDLAAEVSDAVVALADSEAIRLLLGNRSAAIRESTLDALIARAADHTEWHPELVQRPHLSPRNARALAEFVAHHLLDELTRRPDLDTGVVAQLRARLEERSAAMGRPRQGPDPTLDEAVAEASRLRAEGALTEDMVLGAAQRGETRMLTAMLAVCARVRPAVVERAAALRSTKGLVSLVWKAGFSMRVAGSVQSVLARLPPTSILSATADGGFPLALEEMRWQLEFLSRTGR